MKKIKTAGYFCLATIAMLFTVILFLVIGAIVIAIPLAIISGVFMLALMGLLFLLRMEYTTVLELFFFAFLFNFAAILLRGIYTSFVRKIVVFLNKKLNPIAQLVIIDLPNILLFWISWSIALKVFPGVLETSIVFDAIIVVGWYLCILAWLAFESVESK